MFSLCVAYFESLHRQFCAVKRRLICQTRWLGIVTLTLISRNWEMAALQKRQNNISHICVPLLLCKPCVFISSSYCPSLCKKWNFGSLNNRKGLLKFLIQQELQATMLQMTLCPWWSFLIWHSRIIVDIIKSCSLLPESSWALECKNLKFHTSSLFSPLYKHASSITWLVC